MLEKSGPGECIRPRANIGRFTGLYAEHLRKSTAAFSLPGWRYRQWQNYSFTWYIWLSPSLASRVGSAPDSPAFPRLSSWIFRSPPGVAFIFSHMMCPSEKSSGSEEYVLEAAWCLLSDIRRTGQNAGCSASKVWIEDKRDALGTERTMRSCPGYSIHDGRFDVDSSPPSRYHAAPLPPSSIKGCAWPPNALHGMNTSWRSPNRSPRGARATGNT